MSVIDRAARFWAKIFGISFVFGVVTGIPMEFQFGTNWSHFSKFAGGVIGQTLAMEGTFAFFLESAFLGLFLFGEKRMSKVAHWWTGMAVFFGSWLSGYFIIATDAWMQHPVAYQSTADGSVTLSSFWGLVLNPWALWQYAHNMAGAAVTGAFVMAAVGAYYLLSEKHVEQGKIFIKVGVICRNPLLAAGDWTDRRWAGPQSCEVSTGGAGRHGSPFRYQDRRSGHSRPAQRGNQEHRQSACRAQSAELPGEPRLEVAGARSELVPRVRVADEHLRFSTTPTTSWWGWAPSSWP